MRLRESLVKGELLDLDTDSGDLFPMHEDQTEATNEASWPFQAVLSPPKAEMSANGDQEAKQAAACKALADSFDEDNEQAEDLILEQKEAELSPVALAQHAAPRGRPRGFDPRRASLAIAQNFSAAVEGDGLLGEDEIMELSGKPRAQPGTAAFAAAMRASTNKFAGFSSRGEDSIKAHRPAALSLPSDAAGDDNVSGGPLMAESPMAGGHRVSKARQSLPVQQSVAMRDSMALFLQLEGAVKGENGFEAKDVLRLNEAARAHLPCISEVAKSAPEETDGDAAKPRVPALPRHKASARSDTAACKAFSSEGMRDSMALFLQLEGALGGSNGFQPKDVLQLQDSAVKNPRSTSAAAAAAAAIEGLGSSLEGCSINEHGPLLRGARGTAAIVSDSNAERTGGRDEAERVCVKTEELPVHHRAAAPTDPNESLGSPAVATTRVPPPVRPPAAGPPPTGRPTLASLIAAAAPSTARNTSLAQPPAAPKLRAANSAAPSAPAGKMSLAALRQASAQAGGGGSSSAKSCTGTAGARSGTGGMVSRLGAAAAAKFGLKPASAGKRLPGRQATITRQQPPAEKPSSLLDRRTGPDAKPRVPGTRTATLGSSRTEAEASFSPLAAGRLPSTRAPEPAAAKFGTGPQSLLGGSRSRRQPEVMAERALQPKQAPQPHSCLPRAAAVRHETPTPKKGSPHFQKMLEEALNRGDPSAFAGKGCVKNSPLEGQKPDQRATRPTAEQRHFMEYMGD